MQRRCTMEAIHSDIATTASSGLPGTTASRQTNDVNSENQIRPVFGNSRRKRFMAMVPQQREPPTSEPELLMERSTCPWRMVQDYNATRFPRSMERAVCLHNNGDNRCDTSFLDVNRTNSHVRNMLGLLQIHTECALIYAKVNIVVECCDRGIYFRQMEPIDWPVACTCSRKRTISVTPSSVEG